MSYVIDFWISGTQARCPSLHQLLLFTIRQTFILLNFFLCSVVTFERIAGDRIIMVDQEKFYLFHRYLTYSSGCAVEGRIHYLEKEKTSRRAELVPGIGGCFLV